MKIEQPKRIIKEDFPSENYSLVDKLAYVLNGFIEQIYQLTNKNISLQDNINCQVKEITAIVDASGIPKINIQFQSSLKSSSKGIMVIRALNQTDTGVYPSGAVFVSYTESGGVITINKINGLQADNKYSLTIVSFA